MLLRGASLEGRVLDDRGQPLSGVEVELELGARHAHAIYDHGQ